MILSGVGVEVSVPGVVFKVEATPAGEVVDA